MVVFAFSQHEGEPIGEHPDYLDWMLREDFPRETKETIRRLRAAGFRWPPACQVTARYVTVACEGDHLVM